MTEVLGTHERPAILVIDDDAKASDYRLVDDLSEREVTARLVHPEELTPDLLEGVLVVAADHYLETWGQRDRAPTGQQVMDGIALCSVIRSVIESANGTPHSVQQVSYVIRTNKLELLRGSIPSKMSQHMLAAHYGLDWVQSKVDDTEGQLEADRLSALARAVKSLPGDWHAVAPSESEQLAQWLGLAGAPFEAAALQQIEDCHPTAHRLAQQTSGSGFLRWFLHRVLPYPTFLVGDVRAALALGMTLDAFEALVESGADDAQDIIAAEYLGHLRAFFGRRWWVAGLEAAAAQNRADRARLPGALSALGIDPAVHLHSSRGLVVVLDGSLEPSTAPIPVGQAVRIQPDSWPSFADDAWTAIDEAVADPELRAIVVAADRERLPSAG